MKAKIGSALLIVAVLLVLFFGTRSCLNSNFGAKNLGGTHTITLKNKKLVNVTWKGDSVWMLTRDLKEGETLETYEFHEESNVGFIQGTVKIIETRE